MNIPMTWEERSDFANLIHEAIEAVESRNAPETQRVLSEFTSTALMLSLEALGQMGGRFQDFFSQNVLPQWDSKAANTLVFCLEETARGFQSPEFETAFIPLLDEVTLYLQRFPMENTEGEQEERLESPVHSAFPVSIPSTASAHPGGQTPGTWPNDPHLLRTLLQIDPASGAFVLLADQLCHSRDWDEAIEICRRGLLRHPFSLQGQILLGWALWETGRSEEAEETLRRAQKQLEKGAVLYRVLGEMAQNKGDLEEALSYFHIHEKLEGQKTPNPEAHEGLKTQQGAESTQAGAAAKPGVTEVLSELMDRCEKAAGHQRKDSFRFSKEDRERLKSILRRGAMQSGYKGK